MRGCYGNTNVEVINTLTGDGLSKDSTGQELRNTQSPLEYHDLAGIIATCDLDFVADTCLNSEIYFFNENVKLSDVYVSDLFYTFYVSDTIKAIVLLRPQWQITE